MQKAKSVKCRPGKADRPGRGTLSAQQTIPYVRMLKDGVCHLPGGLFTKTLAYEDINYSVASTEDQSAIFNGWSAFLNYFDSSIPFQLSFINRRSHSSGRYQINIFSWADVVRTGQGTKEAVAPFACFDFSRPRTFRVGRYWGAASYLQIMASELSDRLLREILELDTELTVTVHIQTVDQTRAIKTIKGKARKSILLQIFPDTVFAAAKIVDKLLMKF